MVMIKVNENCPQNSCGYEYRGRTFTGVETSPQLSNAWVIRDGNRVVPIYKNYCTVLEENNMTTWNVGDKFQYSGAEYILASVGLAKVNLIGVLSGGRISTEPIRVGDTRAVTLDELKKVMGGVHSLFTGPNFPPVVLRDGEIGDFKFRFRQDGSVNFDIRGEQSRLSAQDIFHLKELVRVSAFEISFQNRYRISINTIKIGCQVVTLDDVQQFLVAYDKYNG